MSDEWQEMGNAPLDRQILLDVGLPWPVVGFYCAAREAWLYASPNKTNDYFEALRCQKPKCWRELPKLRGLE